MSQCTAIVYIGEVWRYILWNLKDEQDVSDTPLRKIIGNGLRPDIWDTVRVACCNPIEGLRFGDCDCGASRSFRGSTSCGSLSTTALLRCLAQRC